MKIGYIRVSTAEQNTIRQEVLLKELGVDELFIDKASGKNTDRPELKRMLTYVRQGDTVIVESISRFARNTVDSLVTVRKLKEHGVEIFFEKENIWTLDSKGELLITIMSSLAQEEDVARLQQQVDALQQQINSFSTVESCSRQGSRVIDTW